jgi:hypothetical protein
MLSRPCFLARFLLVAWSAWGVFSDEASRPAAQQGFLVFLGIQKCNKTATMHLRVLLSI